MTCRIGLALGLGLVWMSSAIAAVPQPTEQLPIQSAIGRAKQSGLPMLVVGTTEHCPYCVKLRTMLSTDPELKQLMPQYVPIELKVDTPDWEYWTKSFKPAGSGVPMIYIVSAAGKQLYNQAGLPQGDELKKVLLQGIAQTGGPKKIGPQHDAMLTASKKIDFLLQHNKKAEAIAMAAKHASSTNSGDKLAGLIHDWTHEATEQLKTANADLKSTDKAVEAVVAAMAVQRTYGALPEVKEAVKSFVADVQKKKQGADLLEQARALDKGRVLEERDSKRAAATAYQAVITQYPDTPAARLAQQRLDGLEAKTGKNELAKAGSAGGDDKDPADERKLKSYLKMASAMADRNPEKAREYLTKILDQAPKSETANEAREMLKGL